MYGCPQKQEMVGQDIFLKYINGDEFEIHNTNQGAHADLLIKPKNEEEWLAEEKEEGCQVRGEG